MSDEHFDSGDVPECGDVFDDTSDFVYLPQDDDDQGKTGFTGV